MMIVLAIIAIVMGLLVGPMVMRYFEDSKKETTAIKVRKFAYEAYPAWAAVNHKSCPDNLSDLNQYMNDQSAKGINDGWGNPLEMSCNRPGVQGFAVWSHGKDGQPDTADDIKSWTD